MIIVTVTQINEDGTAEVLSIKSYDGAKIDGSPDSRSTSEYTKEENPIDSFIVTSEMLEWANKRFSEKNISISIESLTDAARRFVLYWKSKGSIPKDIESSFRLWVENGVSKGWIITNDNTTASLPKNFSEIISNPNKEKYKRKAKSDDTATAES